MYAKAEKMLNYLPHLGCDPIINKLCSHAGWSYKIILIL